MNKWIKLLVSIGISGLGLYYAFNQVELDELWQNLKSTNLMWLSIAIILLVFSVAIRAERWQMLLEPIDNIRFHPLFGATMVGYFGNAILPFRLGELLRAYTISTKKNLETSSAFGTILFERILDMLGLVGTIVIFGWFYPFDSGVREIMITVVILTITGFGFMLALGRAQSHLVERIEVWSIFKNEWAHRILSMLNKMVEGLTSIRATRHVGQIVILTIFIWVVYYAITYCVIMAAGIDINWIAVGVILVSTSLAIAIPAAPGAVGTYHAAAIYVLTEFFVVGRVESQAFAVLLHGVGYVPLIIIGAMYFLRSSVQIKDLSDQSIIE